MTVSALGTRPQVSHTGGIDVDNVTIGEVRDLVALDLARNIGGWIVTVNVDILRRAHRDRDFARLLRTATLRVADGMPLLWLAKSSGQQLRERITGEDLIWALAEVVEELGESIAFIGSTEAVSLAATSRVKAARPGLDVSLRECPPHGFERDYRYVEHLCAQLADAAPAVVFVALGSPKQDWLIARLREAVPCAWFVGIGGALDFVSLTRRRAPGRLQRVGLEWLFRFANEPKRLGRRYFVDDLPFTIAMLASAHARRLGGLLAPAGRK
jgi:exopolysaccharide biosynthesis WecB/TagA/CpsF family protein